MTKPKTKPPRQMAKLTLPKIKKSKICEYFIKVQSISKENLDYIKDYNLLINYKIKSSFDYYIISVKGYPSSIKRLRRENNSWILSIAEDNIFETFEY